MKEHYPVIKGAEAFFLKGNEIGILISHGFVGTPQSVKYLGESLAQYGYTVHGPRLKGHGTHYRDMDECTHEDWFVELEKGYNKLKQHCSTIFIIGQSMGGILALQLAKKHPDIKGIALINAALSVPSYDLLRGKTYPKYISEGEPDLKIRGVHEITYTKVPLTAIHELQNLMEIAPALLSKIKCPLLCFKSAEDHVVPPENSNVIYNKIGSKEKELITLENSYHVASMDYDKDAIVQHFQEFIKRQVERVGITI